MKIGTKCPRTLGVERLNLTAPKIRQNPHVPNQFPPQAPVAQKFADEVVFRRFQGEGVEFFFNRTSLTPSDF